MRRFVLSVAAGLLVSLTALPISTTLGQGTAWEYVGAPCSIFDLYLHEDNMLWAGAGGEILRMLSGGRSGRS